MSLSGSFLSFPAVLLPGMQHASVVRTQTDATNALAALVDKIAHASAEAPIASVAETALRGAIWGGKNAGRECRFALECAKQLQQLVQNEITDVVICGNSASISQGYSLETYAALDGWHLFNIFGLPYTLESATAHTISVAVSARGARLALSSGEGSGLAALQFVENLLAENPARTIIWGAAEQFSEGVKAVLSAEGRRARSRCLETPLLHFEGSVLFSVTGARVAESAFKIIEVHDLNSSDALDRNINLEPYINKNKRTAFYVNSASKKANIPDNISDYNIFNIHDKFGDGYGINPFVPFIHMIERSCDDEIVILLSDGRIRWQLLRAERLSDD